MSVIDSPVKMRADEALDTAAVAGFLRRHIDGLQGPVSVRQFPSGFSNLTYMVRVGDRELVLRRPPFGTKARSAHDMGREYRILKALHPVFPYAPKPLAYCEDPDVLGCPFYVMERIRGIILRKELPADLRLSPDDARRLCEKLLDVQLELHGIDYRRAGLADFGKPDGYVRRQVDGWCRRYVAARTDDAPDFEALMAWLHEKMPTDAVRAAVIHNDYKLDNVVLDPGDPLNIIGVLDWEMATIGDPLMDLGNSLAYWVQADDPPDLQAIRLMPTHIPGALTRTQLVERYCAAAGLRADHFDFYYGFGLFRLAVIAQQIYYRYFHGQTRDPRFKTLIVAVNSLARAAARVMKRSDL